MTISVHAYNDVDSRSFYLSLTNPKHQTQMVQKVGPERAHDETIEDHLARVQQVTDGDLRFERGRHRGGLDAKQSTDGPSEAATQRRVQHGGLQLGRLDL